MPELDLHGQRVSYHLLGQGPAIVLIHGITSSSRTWRSCCRAGRAAHGHRARPARSRPLGQAARRLLAWRLRQRRTRPARRPGLSTGDRRRALPRRRHRDAVRLPVPRSRSSGWCWSTAAASARRSASCSARRRCRAPSSCSPFCSARHAHRGARVAGVLGRLGVKANANMRGLAEGLDSLGDSDARRAFVHTARSVIDPRGQRVDARDLLYLSEDVPTMLIWGERDPIIPLDHGRRAHELMPRQPVRGLPRRRPLPVQRRPRAFRRGAHRLHRVHGRRTQARSGSTPCCAAARKPRELADPVRGPMHAGGSSCTRSRGGQEQAQRAAESPRLTQSDRPASSCSRLGAPWDRADRTM